MNFWFNFEYKNNKNFLFNVINLAHRENDSNRRQINAIGLLPPLYRIRIRRWKNGLEEQEQER